MIYRCQVCNSPIGEDGYIEEDTGVRICGEHYDEILSRNMLDARYTLSRTADSIIVSDLQGSDICTIQHEYICRYYPLMSDLELYETIYGEHYDVLADLGAIEI